MSTKEVAYNRFEAPELRRLRAMKALELRIGGMSMALIGKELNCNARTVQALIDWARKEGLTDEYEVNIIQRLVPKAIKVYEAQLDSNDPYVAKDVIDKLIKLGDRYQARTQAKEELGLAAYLADRKTRPRGTPRAPATVVADIIDAEPISPGLLPDAGHHQPLLPPSGQLALGDSVSDAEPTESEWEREFERLGPASAHAYQSPDPQTIAAQPAPDRRLPVA